MGGVQYRVMMLDPLVAADIIADLGFILAPVAGAIGGVVVKEKGASIGSLLGGVDPEAASETEKSDEDKDLEELDEELGLSGLSPDSAIDVAFERAVLGFFGRFSKEKQRELIDIMAKQTMVINSGENTQQHLPGIFRAHFKGKIGEMYRWLAFAMKVQFKGFFTGQDGATSGVLDKLAAAADLTK